MSASSSESRAVLQLHVNGEAQTFRPGAASNYSVAALLESLDLGGQRVAVAVNRSVVVRSRYEKVELAEGDRVEILEAVGGG